MYSYIILLVVFVITIVADLYDIRLTVKGIKVGAGIEGNSIITTLAGTDKPTFFQLLLINMLLPILPFGVAGMIFGYDNGPVAALFTICLAFQAYGHWRGGREWVYLINGGDPNAPKTWWQKFLQI